MATITNISVVTDQQFYSRYDSSYNIVTATITFSPSPTTDVLTIQWQRNSLAAGGQTQPQSQPSPGPTISAPIPLGPAQTITLTGGTSPVTTSLNLTTVADSDGYMLAKCSNVLNDYSIVVTTSTSIKATATFTVLPVVPAEMHSRWFYGLPLIAFESLTATVQPTNTTGISITGVGFNSGRGAYALTYNNSTHQITFGNGSPITISPSTTSMVIYDLSNNNVTISVNYSALPSSSTTDTVFIDYKTLQDIDIARSLIQSYKETERGMMTRVEPTHIVSRGILNYDFGIPNLPDPNVSATSLGASGGTWAPTYYDEIADGVSFFKQSSSNQWINIEAPFTNILEVYQLAGFFNKQQTVNIPQSWISFTSRPGIIQLVPTNYAILNWILAQASFYFFFLASDYIPQFWHFDILVGLREGIPQEMRDYIAARSAIELLGQIILARFPLGATSYTISRDGVAESRSITPLFYMQAIQGLERQIGRIPGTTDKALITLRQTYNGMWVRSL